MALERFKAKAGFNANAQRSTQLGDPRPWQDVAGALDFVNRQYFEAHSNWVSSVARVGNLPATNDPANPIRPGSIYLIKQEFDGDELNRLVVFDGGWRYINSLQLSNELRNESKGLTDRQEGDMLFVTENLYKELWGYQNGAWQLLFGEAEIKGWIASLNLFEGTVEELGGTTPGAIPYDQLIDLNALQANGDLSFVGHYWVWTGQPGYVVPVGVPEIGVDLAGAIFNPGDWLMVANRGGDGTGVGAAGAPIDLMWVHVGGDLLAKSRGDKLYGLQSWVDGSWEVGSLVNYNGAIWRAKQGIVAGDTAPSTTPPNNWEKVELSGGVRWVTEDTGLPATAPNGELWFILGSAQWGAGAGALVYYDAGSASWEPLGGGAPTGDVFGEIKMFAVQIPALPTGWQVCDGSVIDATLTAARAVLGNTVPDLRDRFIRGESAGNPAGTYQDATTGEPTGGLTLAGWDAETAPQNYRVIFAVYVGTAATQDEGDGEGPIETPTPSESGPFVLNGYYPLFDTVEASNTAGNGSSHTHAIDTVVYFMPNGVDVYHGTYPPTLGTPTITTALQAFGPEAVSVDWTGDEWMSMTTFNWGSTVAGDIFDNAAAMATVVTYDPNVSGNRTISCMLTSAHATDSPVSDQVVVDFQAVSFGNVTITGPSQVYVNQEVEYSLAWDGNFDPEVHDAHVDDGGGWWTNFRSIPHNDGTANWTGGDAMRFTEHPKITFTQPGTYQITLTTGSPEVNGNAGVSAPTITITVEPQPTIGNITVTGPTTVTVGETNDYSFTWDGTLQRGGYLNWITNDPAGSIPTTLTFYPQVTFNTVGTWDLEVSFANNDASDSPQTGLAVITVEPVAASDLYLDLTIDADFEATLWLVNDAYDGTATAVEPDGWSITIVTTTQFVFDTDPTNQGIAAAETNNGDGTYTYVLTQGALTQGSAIELDEWIPQYITVNEDLKGRKPADLITSITGASPYWS